MAEDALPGTFRVGTRASTRAAPRRGAAPGVTGRSPDHLDAPCLNGAHRPLLVTRPNGTTPDACASIASSRGGHRRQTPWARRSSATRKSGCASSSARRRVLPLRCRCSAGRRLNHDHQAGILRSLPCGLRGATWVEHVVQGRATADFPTTQASCQAGLPAQPQYRPPAACRRGHRPRESSSRNSRPCDVKLR